MDDVCEIRPAARNPLVVLSSDIWNAIMKTRNFELLEIPIEANQPAGQVLLKPNGLTTKAIRGIETWSAVNIPISPTGKTVISAADLAKCYLKLDVGGVVQINLLPLVSLNRMAVNSGSYGAAIYGIQEFEDIQGVDWSKSYIIFGAVPAVGAFSIMLGIHYVG